MPSSSAVSPSPVQLAQMVRAVDAPEARPPALDRRAGLAAWAVVVAVLLVVFGVVPELVRPDVHAAPAAEPVAQGLHVEANVAP